MIQIKYFVVLFVIIFNINRGESVRLTNLFNYIEGIKLSHTLRGFLHLGNKYAVFIRTPKPHSSTLTYELYEINDKDDLKEYKPRLLAVSEVPIKYIQEQLKIFKEELYNTKNVDANIVPGTKAKTLREWQIEEALKDVTGNKVGLSLLEKPKVFRTIL